MRVEMSDQQQQQQFLPDPDSLYVWVYEPPPSLLTWLAGGALIVAVILCCLFPIWPAPLRLGAYYLSVGASGLLGLFLAVGLLRFGLFLLVGLVTLNHYSFWLFPRYFDECGVLESFRPLYSFTPAAGAVVGGDGKKKAGGGKKARAAALMDSKNNSTVISSSADKSEDTSAVVGAPKGVTRRHTAADGLE